MKKLFNDKTKERLINAIVIAAVIAGSFAFYVVVRVAHNVMIISKMPPPTDYNYVTYPQTNTAGRDPELVKRGEYLAKAGDCVACHSNTPVKGAPFGGGLPITTSFGTIYSPNITPDKDTGIGGWTLEQFSKAMRDGVSPEGQFYYPAFPYYYFNSLSDDDIKALKAYFDSIPPVRQKNHPNDMVPPFNFRIMQLGWRIMFFYPNANGTYKHDDKQSAEWNRGAYLVDGLGHCAMCHTPSYNIFDVNLPLGAPIRKYNLTGAPIQGYLAPNITKSLLGGVPDQEVVNVFLKDIMIGGGKVVGPMAEVNHDSLSYLSREDLLAITTYLKTVNSPEPPRAKGGAPGVGTYEGYCAACHAMGSAGAPKFGNKDDWTAVLKKYPIATVYLNAIKGINGMPAKGTCTSCSDDEIKLTVNYMMKGDGESSAAGPTMQLPKPLTPEQGKDVYEHQCSSCHTSGSNGAPKMGDYAAWTPILQQDFVTIYRNVTGNHSGHPPHAGCTSACTDAEVKAALEYLLDQSSKSNNYSLW
jgi:cytochrome c5/cytochrome c553